MVLPILFLINMLTALNSNYINDLPSKVYIELAKNTLSSDSGYSYDTLSNMEIR